MMKHDFIAMEKRVYRIELMMYVVIAKIGYEGLQATIPVITTIWRALW